MEVLFTTPDARLLSQDGYAQVLREIFHIAEAYKKRPDERILVVVLAKPSTKDPKLQKVGAVLVSPICDIEDWGGLEKPDVRPSEAPLGVYLASFRSTIERALSR